MTKTARAVWAGGLRFDAESRATTLVTDGGADAAESTPSGLVLAALAGCTGMDVAAILVKKRQPPTTYVVEVTGEQQEKPPRVFREIVITHLVEGEAVDPEAVRRSVELSATRYCPVTAMLAAGPIRIEHRYRLRNASGEHEAEVVITGPDGAGLEPVQQPSV